MAVSPPRSSPTAKAIDAWREPNPRWFIEFMTHLGCEVVVEHPNGSQLVFLPHKHPDEGQVREAIRLLARPLSPLALAEAQRILDEEARRILVERQPQR